MTATCKEKHQLQNSRISASSKAGDITQHSKVGKRLFGMGTSVRISVSEEQEYPGLTVKVRLMAQLLKEAFTPFSLVLTGKVHTPTS